MSADAEFEGGPDTRTELVGGVVHREYWGWDHHACITYCLNTTPGHRAGNRPLRHHYCPGCGGKVAVRPMEGTDMDPVPSRTARLAAWTGEWVTAFMDAVVFPFRGPATAELEREELIKTAARSDQETT
jgi:hypothetical protein